MQFFKSSLGVFFLLIFTLRGNAQKPTLVFHHLSLYEGLSESTIRAVVEGQKGFMWFGTEDGLNKYDGFKFKIYRSNSIDNYSISNSYVKHLFKDSKGQLWIITRNGLNLYDPLLDRFHNYRTKSIKALENLKGDFESITEDPTGNLWIAAGDEGMYKITSLDQPAENYKPKFNSENQYVMSLQFIEPNKILIGTHEGIINFNSITKSFNEFAFDYDEAFSVKKILIDKNNNILLATSDGVKVLNSNMEIIKEFTHDPLNPYSLNGNNTIDIIPFKENYLIAMDGTGIDYFETKTERFYHYTNENESQLSSNNINSLYIDSKGDIWAGTFLNGINFSNSTTNLFALFKNNPFSENGIKKGIITGFLNDSKGNFWISTDGGGLYKRPFGQSKLINYTSDMGDKGISGMAVIDIVEDDKGNIWIGTYNEGLSMYNPQTDKFKFYKNDPNNPQSIGNNRIKNICYYKGKLWISGYGTGISILDPETETCQHMKFDKHYNYGIPSDWIQTFFIDSQDNLWLGSFKGLSKYQPSTNNFVNYHFENNKKNAENPNSINDIYEDSFHNMWLATAGGGIIYFRPGNGTYRIFTTSNGLASNNVRAIIEDQYNNLWISTNNGLTKFDIVSKKGKAYTFRDGVPPAAFFWQAKFKDRDNKIYFGTSNGYLVIDPGMTLENKKIPPIVITELKIFNEIVLPNTPYSPLKQDISETKEITLPYNQNSITFEFASLNFNNSQNNQFSYFLEGFDREWVDASNQRTATYTNLNPGKYIFRIKGSNNDNIWNEVGVAMSIIITPPFYQTWWFNTLLIICSLVTLYLIYFLRTRRIRKENMVLEKIVKKRTKELEDANEQLETFVYRASHDIKGPLKSIIGLTTIGQKDVKDETSITYFNHILKSTLKLDNLLMDLLQITKVKQAQIVPEKINFEDLVNQAIVSFENLPDFKRIKIDVNINENGDFHSDKKLVYSLIQNLIENPIKYLDTSKNENILNISINSTSNSAQLSFKDNGVGIAPDYQKKVFDMFYKINETSNGTGLGLYIVKTTVEKLKGNIELESALGKGSLFTVTLKNRNN